MLRLGLLENLRRLAEQILQARAGHCRAQEFAEHLLALEENEESSTGPRTGGSTRVNGSVHRSPGLLTDPCVVRLMELLRDHGPAGGHGCQLAGEPPRGTRRHPRRDPPPPASAPGRQPGVGRQLCGQSAAAVDPGLGAPSSIAPVWSRRFCATTRPGSTPARTSPPGIVTAA